MIAGRYIEVDSPVRMLIEWDRQGTDKATPALALIEITFTPASRTAWTRSSSSGSSGKAAIRWALSPDGYERTIAINHVALAALTDGLLDLLRKGADVFAAPSRVVNMTALVESRGKPVTDWSYPGKYKQIQAYADAKLLALMYTYAQARRHAGEGLTFNAVSPGAVKTTLGSKAGGPFKIIEALTNPFVGPPEKGSRGCVRLMADPELATATGGYYSSAKLKKSSEKSQDAEGQERIYAQTERELRAHP